MKNKITEDIEQVWKVKMPLFNNPLLWFQMFILVICSSGFLFLLLLTLNLFEHRWEDIPSTCMVAAIIALFLFAAMSLIWFLINRGITTRYTINNEMVIQETLTSYGKFARIFTFFAALTGGSRGATIAGASLLAESRQAIGANWKDISNVNVYKNRFEIRLKNQWRTVIQIICLPENFQAVLSTVNKNVTIKKIPEEDSIFKQVIYTFFALLLGVYLLPRLPVHFVGAFTIPMIILAFPAIWATKKLQKFSAVIILILLTAGISLAFYFGEVNFEEDGAIYAMAIECLAFIFYFHISTRVFFKWFKNKSIKGKK